MSASETRSKIAGLVRRLFALVKGMRPELDALKTLHEQTDLAAKAFGLAIDSAGANRLLSANDDVNKLYAMGSALHNFLAREARRDEVYWVEHSGANLFSAYDTTEAVKRLSAAREQLDRVKSACEGLKGLVLALSAADYAKTGVASLYSSAVVIDVIARKDTVDQFDYCVADIASIRVKLGTALASVQDMGHALQAFIADSRNPSRFTDKLQQQSPFFKAGMPEQLRLNPWAQGKTKGSGK